VPKICAADLPPFSAPLHFRMHGEAKAAVLDAGPAASLCPSRRGYAALHAALAGARGRQHLPRSLAPCVVALLLSASAVLAARHFGHLGLLAAPGLEAVGGMKALEWPPAWGTEREACGLVEEGVDYRAAAGVEMTEVAVLQAVGSAAMCCAACAGFPECGAWTWGRKRGMEFLTDVCFLKGLGQGQAPAKVPNADVVSGLPAQGLRKHGVVPAPASATGRLEGVVPRQVPGQRPATAKCPGALALSGHGPVALVRARTNTPGTPAGPVEVLAGDLVVPHMGGRAYFADACSEGAYDRSQYLALKLLGKRLRYTTDVSGTGCGCNAAFYLTSMQQNVHAGKCSDYYCDAMSVCGTPCAEIDLQEANQYAWFSTLHTFSESLGPDSLGVARGYGGSLGEPPRRDWGANEYGPGSRCINTERPFNVTITFPVNDQGSLVALQVTLSQQGSPCPLSASIDAYHIHGRDGLAELSAALAGGMTPIISYWSSKDMLWMDGLGADGLGPCVKDDPEACPDAVRFYGFTIENIDGAVPV